MLIQGNILLGQPAINLSSKKLRLKIISGGENITDPTARRSLTSYSTVFKAFYKAAIFSYRTATPVLILNSVYRFGLSRNMRGTAFFREICSSFRKQKSNTGGMFLISQLLLCHPLKPFHRLTIHLERRL